MSLKLYKKEKLCSHTAVELLFFNNEAQERVCGSSLVYPWRVVWRINDARPEGLRDVAQFLIMVPKKRVRHAVDRVLMRRRCREVYRLHRHLLPEGVAVDMAFVYVGKPGYLAPYDITCRAVTRLMTRVGR